MEPSLPRLMDRGIHVSRITRAGVETRGKSPGLPTPRNEKCPIYNEKNPQIEFLLRMGIWKNAWNKKGGFFSSSTAFLLTKEKAPCLKKCQILRERHFSLISDRGQPVAGKGVETLVTSPHTAETSISRSQTVFIQNWYIPVGNQPTSISWTVRRASPSFSSSAERSRTDSSTCGEKTPHFPLYFFLVKKQVFTYLQSRSGEGGWPGILFRRGAAVEHLGHPLLAGATPVGFAGDAFFFLKKKPILTLEQLSAGLGSEH